MLPGSPMRFVFVMDPVDIVLVDEDTSFALMLEAQSRGHRVDHCLPRDLFLDRGELFARARPATMRRDKHGPIALGDTEDVPLGSVDAILVRKDPPFDDVYLWTTLLLERVRGRTFTLNDPRGLRDANEKLYTCGFRELMPDTLVSNDKVRIKEFVSRVGGRAVIKPLDGAGGAGVMQLVAGDLNINAIIEGATYYGRRIAMVQAFIPEVKQGDKRILLLEGEPLGAILRVPRADELRSNIHVGGTVEHTTLDDRDHAIVSALRPHLVRDGLWFVGLDVIGGKLTEINVTSPTGIQQMERLGGEKLSARVIEWIERRASAIKRGSMEPS